MRLMLLPLLLVTAGCESYVATEIDVVAQARRGVALTQKSFDEKSRLIRDAQSLRRTLIDEAFDDDVRARQRSPEPLTSDWIIEHRRAYAAALDGLAQQSAASRDAEAADRRNLAALDDALRR